MPALLLYIDEAHTTQTNLWTDWEGCTNYSALTRAIDTLKLKPLLALFTSTASHLYELAPPQMIHNSDWVMTNDVIPLPFWELPFNANVGQIKMGTLTLNQITSIEHIVKFGCPL